MQVKCRCKPQNLGVLLPPVDHMWPFGEKPGVRALDERLTALERAFKALELEWDDTYDKLRRAMGRVVKSRAIIEAAEKTSDAEEPAEANGNDQVSRGRLLNPRQMQLQQQILKRRGG